MISIEVPRKLPLSAVLHKINNALSNFYRSAGFEYGKDLVFKLTHVLPGKTVVRYIYQEELVEKRTDMPTLD